MFVNMTYLNAFKSWTCQMCDMRSSNGWILKARFQSDSDSNSIYDSDSDITPVGIIVFFMYFTRTVSTGQKL